MTPSKEIWLPKSEMTVTVQDGVVVVSETMTMAPRPVAIKAGFATEKKA